MSTSTPPWDLIVGFADEMSQDQYKPQRKFLREALYGVISSGSVMLSSIGRALHCRAGWDEDDADQRFGGSLYNHTEKRLSRNLNSDRLNEEAIERRYLEKMAPLLQRDGGAGVVVAVDGSDICKPYADRRAGRGMEYVHYKYDGSVRADSDGNKLTLGYPIVEVDASLPDDTRIPLAYRVYSTEAPDYISELREFEAAIQQVKPHIGPEAWWAADSGFDGNNYFQVFDDTTDNWVIRLNLGRREARHLQDEDLRHGPLSARVVAERTRPSFEIDWTNSRRTRRFAIGYRSVRTTTMRGSKRIAAGPMRTLVVVRGLSNQTVALLVSRRLRSDEEAADAVEAYLRRWGAEEFNRAVADSRGWGPRLEDVRAMKLRGVRRLTLFAVIAYGFLAWMQREAVPTVNRLLRRVLAPRQQPRDGRYRLWAELAAVLRDAPAAVKKAIRKLPFPRSRKVDRPRRIRVARPPP